MKEGKKKQYIYLAIVIMLVVIDQITKILAIGHNGNVISGILDITTVQNRGGAFGVGQNSTLTFLLTNIVVIGIIIRFMVVQNDVMELKIGTMLSTIIAGGLGNVIDRIFRGYVVDFIDFSKFIPFPVFNLADVFIAIGVIGIAIFFGIATYKKRNKTNKVEKD